MKSIKKLMDEIKDKIPKKEGHHFVIVDIDIKQQPYIEGDDYKIDYTIKGFLSPNWIPTKHDNEIIKLYHKYKYR